MHCKEAARSALLGHLLQHRHIVQSTSVAVAVYQTEGEDLSGHTKYFKKPWASTALMFVAMVMCLPIAWIAAAIESHRKKSAASSERKPLLGEEGDTSTEQGKQNSATASCASNLPQVVRTSAKVVFLCRCSFKACRKVSHFQGDHDLGIANGI